MQIMFLIPRMNNGGAERVVANLSNEFCKEHNVQITTLVGSESFYKINSKIKIKSAGVELNRYSCFTRTFSMIMKFGKAVDFIKKECDTCKPDVVISFLYETDIIMYLITRRKHDFIWVSSERNDPTRVGKIKQLIASKIYNETDLFVAQSNYIKDFFVRISNVKKVVIPNPIDIEKIPYVIEENIPKKIVAVGRMMKQKNYLLLLQSYKEALKSIYCESELIIYGEGVERKSLEIYIEQNNLQERVRLPGAQINVIEKIRDAAVFIMASDYEGFPNALLEAIAIGIPVIATDIKTETVRELISDDVGILVPVGDRELLTAAIIKMLNDDKYRLFIRGKKTRFIREKYDCKYIAKEWINAIERTINGAIE